MPQDIIGSDTPIAASATPTVASDQHRRIALDY